MKVIGVDFTSAPGNRKPIVAAICSLEATILMLEEFKEFTDWPRYELWLSNEDTWIGAFDFPFGLPRRYVEKRGWSSNWSGMVRDCVKGGKDHFAVDAMNAFQSARKNEPLDKHRRTDLAADSESPLKTLANPPVGKMFYEGAWRLMNQNIRIPRLRELDSTRIALEGYPGLLVARLGETYYKNDKPRSASGNLAARRRIIRALEDGPNGPVPARLKLRRRSLRRPLYDPSGDWLDAVLCAMLAAEAWNKRTANFGLPDDVDSVEGWIVSA